MKSLFFSTFKIFGVIKDIKNYIFLRKIIKNEMMDSPLWVKNNLRVDWIGRIYTVINLPPEVTISSMTMTAQKTPRTHAQAHVLRVEQGVVR